MLPNVEVLAGPSLDPASPVLSFASIPGGQPIDTSTLLTGGVPTFGRRPVTLPCLLTSDESLWMAQRRLVPLLQGQLVDVTVSDVPGWHLTGRAALTGWSWPGKGREVLFSLGLDAEAYWWRDVLTSLTVSASASPGTAFSLPQTGYPVMPVATVTGSAVTLVQGTVQTSLPVGVTPWLDGLRIMPAPQGTGPVTGRIVGATTAKIKFEWREGWPG